MLVLIVLGLRLNYMILEVFSNLNDSIMGLQVEGVPKASYFSYIVIKSLMQPWLLKLLILPEITCCGKLGSSSNSFSLD